MKSTKKPIDISIVIVSFNTKDMTLGCLRSVYEQTNSVSFEIIVIDNDSGDGSAEAIEKEFPDIILIKSEENIGFAAANNVGFLQTEGRYVLLLNSDTLLLGNGLKDCHDYLESEKTVNLLVV